MNQNKKVWEKEYQQKNLMRGDKPQRFFLKFIKIVKKKYRKEKKEIDNILDLGSGEGKNSIYLAEQGWKVWGMEFAHNAIQTAKKKADKLDLKISFIEKSFGEKFNLPDTFFDIILDINSSNSLNERERKIYLEETVRVLKPGGYFLVRVPAKDGDHNAKKMIKEFPGKEKDTYIIPKFGLEERIFSRDDLVKLYQKYFQIVELKKETRYTTYGTQKFKRNFWILILKKDV